MDAIIKRFEDVGEKIEQNIDIKITDKLMNKMEAKLERKIEDIPQHKKWIGLTQKSYKNMLERKMIRSL